MPLSGSGTPVSGGADRETRELVGENGRHRRAGVRPPKKGVIYLLSVADGKLRPLVRTPLWQWDLQLSPDGHRIAYASEEDEGKYGIFVRDIREVGGSGRFPPVERCPPGVRMGGRSIT